MNEDFNFSLEEECILFNINEEACHKILKKYCKYFLFKPSSLKSADIYKSIEEKAANFLYLVVKNHVFIDGNKRIAATLFIYFLSFCL